MADEGGGGEGAGRQPRQRVEARWRRRGGDGEGSRGDFGGGDGGGGDGGGGEGSGGDGGTEMVAAKEAAETVAVEMVAERVVAARVAAEIVAAEIVWAGVGAETMPVAVPAVWQRRRWRRRTDGLLGGWDGTGRRDGVTTRFNRIREASYLKVVK